jgi:hypothetical protein
VLTIYLRFTSIALPLLSSPLIPTSTGFILFFHIWIENTFTIYTLIPSFLVPTPSHWYSTLDKIYFFSCLSFFLIKCVLIVQGGFALVLQVCIYHALIKLIPHYLLFIYHQAALIFNTLLLAIEGIILYSHIDELF